MGRVKFRKRNEKFGIYQQDRLRHMLILGQTGVGKSTLIKTMTSSDMQNNTGLMVIDPHGDLAEDLLESVPKHRKSEVVYFNPADKKNPVSFNLLAENLGSEIGLLASAIVLAFQKTWGDFWGPRSEHLLRMALLALLEFEGMCLLDLHRFLSDAKWREKLSLKLKDNIVKKFWSEEFATQPDRLQAESLSPLQNKVGALVGNPIMRRVLGQAKSRLKMAKVLKKNKILLVNLSRGKIGLDACTLLGSMLVSLFEATILTRAELKAEDRKPFFLFIDEFSLFVSPGFVALLAEGRKYGLGISLAQQSIVSVPRDIQSDMLTNSGTLVCFRLGATDAKLLADYLYPVYEMTDLMNLPAWEFAVRLLINGRPSVPFSGGTLN